MTLTQIIVKENCILIYHMVLNYEDILAYKFRFMHRGYRSLDKNFFYVVFY